MEYRIKVLEAEIWLRNELIRVLESKQALGEAYILREISNLEGVSSIGDLKQLIQEKKDLTESSLRENYRDADDNARAVFLVAFKKQFDEQVDRMTGQTQIIDLALFEKLAIAHRVLQQDSSIKITDSHFLTQLPIWKQSIKEKMEKITPPLSLETMGALSKEVFYQILLIKIFGQAEDKKACDEWLNSAFIRMAAVEDTHPLKQGLAILLTDAVNQESKIARLLSVWGNVQKFVYLYGFCRESWMKTIDLEDVSDDIEGIIGTISFENRSVKRQLLQQLAEWLIQHAYV